MSNENRVAVGQEPACVKTCPTGAIRFGSKEDMKVFADTRIADWTVGAEVQASGRRFDTVANTNVLRGYALVNLHASTRIARDYTLLARVDNLADKDYQLARTYATPGRTLYVGVKWAPQ